jgi:hypothetical protein
MAVCEGCGSEVCCLHRKQVAKKARKLAELLSYFEQEYGPVELESKWICIPGVDSLRYDSDTRSWSGQNSLP